jgi:hypothetical protein
MFPANYPAIRPATVHDAGALQALVRADGAAPLSGRIVVAELGARTVAAVSRDDRRVIADAAVACAYADARLWSHLDALEAYERQPDLATRAREAVVGTTPAPEVELPLAA